MEDRNLRPFEAKLLQFSELMEVMDSTRELGQRHLNGDTSEATRISFKRFCNAATARRRVLCSLHEAAHASTFERHGFRVAHVTIKASERPERAGRSVLLGGRVDAEYTPNRDRHWLVAIAAGRIIDEIFETVVNEHFDGCDMRKLANATGGDAEIIASIMAEARQEILNNTSCIERISDALLASETLTGDELRAIIAA
jgi:hypothetical protein